MKTFFFSIIIPTKDRKTKLSSCLKSIENLSYPRSRFEVIVVDDGSREPLSGMIHAFSKRLNITLVQQEPSGPATARNEGATIAKGEIIAFIDDDCRPERDWLIKMGAYFNRDNIDILGGRIINALDENIYSAASQMLIDYLYGYFNEEPKKAAFLCSNNMAFKAGAFFLVNGFDREFKKAAAEDRDLSEKCQRLHMKMVYASDIVVYHEHDMNFMGFLRQHFAYGQGAYQFHRKHSRASLSKIPIAPFSFYFGIATYAFRKNRKNRPIATTLLLVISQIINFCGFVFGMKSSVHSIAPCA